MTSMSHWTCRKDMKDGVLGICLWAWLCLWMPGVDIEREMLRWEEKRNAKSISRRRGQDAHAGKGDQRDLLFSPLLVSVCVRVAFPRRKVHLSRKFSISQFSVFIRGIPYIWLLADPLDLMDIFHSHSPEIPGTPEAPRNLVPFRSPPIPIPI